MTETQLAEKLERIGLAEGDSVIVHSSFRRLGPVDGGPEAVIRAMLRVLGASGNLMLPTFNYLVADGEVFDPAQTPGLTGVLTEVGRKFPGAIRSLNPTHSVAVIGPDAEELTRDHLSFRAAGIDGPTDRLAKRGGKVLLMGVGHISNSMIHIGEEYAGVPKATWDFGLPMFKIRTSDGSVIEHQHDTSGSCSTAFGAAECPLRQRDQIRDLRVGTSKWQLMLAQDVTDNVCEMIRQKPDVLLCTNPNCVPCTGARENLRTGGLQPQS